MNKLVRMAAKFNQPYGLLDFFLGFLLALMGALLLAWNIFTGLLFILIGLYIMSRSKYLV